jgi:hypothetical protein
MFRNLFLENFKESDPRMWHRLKNNIKNTRAYPKVSGLAAWSENCKWYNSLPLGAIVSLFFESF